MNVTPIAGALGAVISGVDLARGTPAALAAEIRQVFLQHKVIFLREQHLTPPQFLAFAEAMGEPIEYPFVKGLPDFPLIIPVLKLPHEKHNFGGVWHTDTTYLAEPPSATMLIARELPPYGGDTLFASNYAAYDALSPGLKITLDQLVAPLVHEARK